MNTKEHIFKTAEDLFFRNGYYATTIRDIATEAAVNYSMVNYYFQTKENLYLQILEQLKYNLDFDMRVVNDIHRVNDRVLLFVSQTINLAQKHAKVIHLFMIEQLQASTEETKKLIHILEKAHFNCFYRILIRDNIYSASLDRSINTLYNAIFGLIKEWIRIKNKINKTIIDLEIKEINKAVEKIILMNGF